MKTAAFCGERRLMDGISLHYYTQSNTWDHKKRATEFDVSDYYRGFVRARRMEELIEKHCEIMSQYDPRHEIGLVVDEWGAWYEVEPGTHPAFLYQQGTMRDALLAAVQLDIFNRHANRVVMANLAQMVNVIHSIILTEGNRMLLTPTYHTFALYKEHQDAQLLDSWLETEEIGDEESRIPNMSHTASMKNGVLTLTISNLSLEQSEQIACYLLGFYGTAIKGRLLQADCAAHNTFEAAQQVKPRELQGAAFTDSGLKFMLPPCSIAQITVSGS